MANERSEILITFGGLLPPPVLKELVRDLNTFLRSSELSGVESGYWELSGRSRVSNERANRLIAEGYKEIKEPPNDPTF